ncbi:hypothetical protein DPMN_078784 [Dreissena polymorpha]|uniref:Uncharacterized protein n=1 Tax=Dreissena polymorpha TaxID=45954 RepID=A0A9D3YMW1_DREPO|nr:hypothetical protein DPMN_078784 [Dreissena polymorpha]
MLQIGPVSLRSSAGRQPDERKNTSAAHRTADREDEFRRHVLDQLKEIKDSIKNLHRKMDKQHQSKLTYPPVHQQKQHFYHKLSRSQSSLISILYGNCRWNAGKRKRVYGRP